MLALMDATCVGLDFDKTIAQTDQPSPNGLDVERGCNDALQRIFGLPNLLAAIGGLQSRAPMEIIRDLFDQMPAIKWSGQKFYIRHRQHFASIMPHKGVALIDINERNVIEIFTELFVRVKLETLLAEVGPAWPKPCPGVLEALEALRNREMHVVIVTSGHELFVRKCFATWGAPCPELLLSDDDLRAQALPIEKKIKPSPVLIDFVDMLAYTRRIRLDRTRMIYVGDDEAKDGGLAHNANLPFGWYNPGGLVPRASLAPDDFVFGDWAEVTAVLQ